MRLRSDTYATHRQNFKPSSGSPTALMPFNDYTISLPSSIISRKIYFLDICLNVLEIVPGSPTAQRDGCVRLRSARYSKRSSRRLPSSPLSSLPPARLRSPLVTPSLSSRTADSRPRPPPDSHIAPLTLARPSRAPPSSRLAGTDPCSWYAPHVRYAFDSPKA